MLPPLDLCGRSHQPEGRLAGDPIPVVRAFDIVSQLRASKRTPGPWDWQSCRMREIRRRLIELH